MTTNSKKLPIDLHFDNLHQVQEYAEKYGKTLLLHQDKILDVTSFSQHHPGGGLLLRNHNLRDIKEAMAFHHPLTLHLATTMAVASFQQEIKRVVDPHQPISPQIWGTDHQTYLKLINSPHWLFVESPRLFSWSWLQWFSHNKWYVVPILPSLLIISFFLRVDDWTCVSLVEMVALGAFGFLFFTLVEYLMHRFLFHSQKWLLDSRLVRYLHFFTHGIHHMLPNDPYFDVLYRDRLVLPQPIFVILWCFVNGLVSRVLVLTDPLAYAVFWSFFLLGYVVYDCSHYAQHHIDTEKYKGSWFHRLQKYHNRHHFSGEEAGFGVSSPLWDIILGTGFKHKKKQ